MQLQGERGPSNVGHDKDLDIISLLRAGANLRTSLPPHSVFASARLVKGEPMDC
jgi:hypothetical protein